MVKTVKDWKKVNKNRIFSEANKTRHTKLMKNGV